MEEVSKDRGCGEAVVIEDGETMAHNGLRFSLTQGINHQTDAPRRAHRLQMNETLLRSSLAVDVAGAPG